MKLIIKRTTTLIIALVICFSVFANTGVNELSVSAVSKSTTAALKKSPVLKKSNIRANSVKLKWNKVKGATTYKVYRSTNKKKWKLVKTLKANTITVKKLEANKKYYFRVRAFKNNTKSPYSKIVSVKTKKTMQSNITKTDTTVPAEVTTTLHSANMTTMPANILTTSPAEMPLTLPVSTTVPNYSDDWEDGTEVKLYHRQSLPYTQGDITITNMKITKEHYNQVDEYGNYYPYKYTILIEGKAPAGTNTINVAIVFSDSPGINFGNPIYQSSFDDDGNFSCTSTYLRFHNSDIFFISRINKSAF